MKTKLNNAITLWQYSHGISEWEKALALLLVLITVICLGVSTNASAVSLVTEHELYSRVFTVVDTNGDIVYIEDCTGNIFSFYGGDDWYVGDKCSCVMDNNCTASIKDDIVLSAHYERIDLLP